MISIINNNIHTHHGNKNNNIFHINLKILMKISNISLILNLIIISFFCYLLLSFCCYLLLYIIIYLDKKYLVSRYTN